MFTSLDFRNDRMRCVTGFESGFAVRGQSHPVWHSALRVASGSSRRNSYHGDSSPTVAAIDHAVAVKQRFPIATIGLYCSATASVQVSYSYTSCLTRRSPQRRSHTADRPGSVCNPPLSSEDHDSDRRSRYDRRDNNHDRSGVNAVKIADSSKVLTCGNSSLGDSKLSGIRSGVPGSIQPTSMRGW
jgi:hypothetical protein